MSTQPTTTTSFTIDETTCDELIEVLAKTLDLRDNDTAGHSDRVRRYSEEIARAVGCSEEEIKQIGRAASLHDLGKIAVDNAILKKKGKLSPEEWRVMEAHVYGGFRLLRRILPEVAGIVHAHHERYDGKGYPRGLKGKEIPLGARIFAVADTMDAMTSDRPYRGALPFSAARKEILSESGRQFDPKVVEAFLAIPEAVLRQVMLDEKRRTVRVPLHGEVVCVENGRQHTLQAVDISVGGLLLEKDEGIPLGREMDVEFELPQVARRLKLKGEAIRREMPDRTAISFKSLQTKDQQKLLRYIARLSEPQFESLSSPAS